jgi:hypothetical protein
MQGVVFAAAHQLFYLRPRAIFLLDGFVTLVAGSCGQAWGQTSRKL